MANKPSRPAPRAADASGGTTKSGRSLWWLWVALGVVVVLIGGFAILSAGDDEELTVGTVPTEEGATDGTGGEPDPDATSGAGTDTTDGSAEVAEAWPVTIDGAALPGLPDSGADPAVGTAAPGMSGFAFDGTPVTIDPSQGPVLLVFLAHWCPHCNREIPQLNAWRDSGEVPEGLQVVGVTTAVDPSADNYPPSSWIDEMDWTWPVIADSPELTAATAFGVSAFPFAVVVGTDGTVLTRWSGEVGEAGVRDRVAEALS